MDIISVGEGTITTHWSTITDVIVEEKKIQQLFHIVPDNFKIPADGILGTDFWIIDV